MIEYGCFQILYGAERFGEQCSLNTDALRIISFDLQALSFSIHEKKIAMPVKLVLSDLVALFKDADVAP